MSMTGKMPEATYDEEMERAVLGGLLLKPTLMNAVRDSVEVDDFYMEKNQLLYRALRRVDEDQLDIDLNTVRAELRRTGHLEQIGGDAYLMALDMSLPDLTAVVGYAEALAGLSAKRSAVQTAYRVIGGLEKGMSADAVVAEFTGAGRLLESAGRGSNARHIRDVLEEIEPPEEYVEVPGLGTGFPLLDKYMGGLVGGRVTIVAGRTGNGKSAFSGVLAYNVAKAGGAVLISSLEMSEADILRRMISYDSGVSHEAILKGRLSPDMWARFRESSDRASSLNVYLDGSPGQTVGSICATARRAKRDGNLDVLVIDYLQLLRGDSGTNRNEQVGEMSRRFKVLAKELDVPVVLLAQVNREGIRTGNWRPKLHMLRESGSIEQDADAVVFTCLPAAEFDQDDPEREEWEGKAVLILAKNRHGQAGLEFHCGWDGSTFSIVPAMGESR